MAQKHRNNQQRKRSPKGPPPPSSPREPFVYERKAPVVYSAPFIVLEDAKKNTFEFKSGAWIPHEFTIAQCRADCQVKELPQKVNNMTRYEVRRPVSMAT